MLILTPEESQQIRKQRLEQLAIEWRNQWIQWWQKQTDDRALITIYKDLKRAIQDPKQITIYRQEDWCSIGLNLSKVKLLDVQLDKKPRILHTEIYLTLDQDIKQIREWLIEQLTITLPDLKTHTLSLIDNVTEINL